MNHLHHAWDSAGSFIVNNSSMVVFLSGKPVQQ